MTKRALLVGINRYDSPEVENLTACVADAEAMSDILSRNGDRSVNFDCRTLTSPGNAEVTRALLRRRWRELFDDFTGDILFYFSGHGFPGDVGGYLVTQDGNRDDPGLPMNELVEMANGSAARSVLIILDCCHSGSAGNAAAPRGAIENRAMLREGVTVLAASRPTELAREMGTHSVFTDLVLGALRGGAADVRGRVSAASIYAYAEAALGAWDQRPLYKSHAGFLDPVRTCQAKVTDAELRELTGYFRSSEDEYGLDPTFEVTSPTAIPANVAIFSKMKTFQLGGLLRPVTGPDLYWAAMHSENVRLTDLGKFYHLLIVADRI